MSAVAAVKPIRPGVGVSASSPVWLSPMQVCERIPGMTVANLQELRKKRKGPAYFKPTLKTVLYDAADVDAWVRGARERTRDQP